MALSEGIVLPVLTINNIAIPYIPNSLKYSNGNPERKSRVQSAGGDSFQRISSTDITTKFSDVTFEMITTSDADKMIDGWQKNGFNNAISITDAGIRKYGGNAGVVNKVQLGTGVDGTVSVEFNCDAFSQ